MSLSNDILSGKSVESTPCLINEKELMDDESTMIPIILNYNSLNILDYIYRLFHASRRELVKSIRSDINYLTENIGPQFDLNNKFEGFEGWHKDAAPVSYCRILSIKPAKLGTDYPDQIIAEIELDTAIFSTNVQEMWLDLRPGEILALVHYTNSRLGYQVGTLRCCEVQSIVYSSQNLEKRRDERQSYLLEQKLRVYLLFDPIQFKVDQQNSVNEGFNLDDIYQSFHIAMRMHKKNNLNRIKDICNYHINRGQNHASSPFSQMYNLKFDSPEDEEYVHRDEKIEYSRLFATEEEFNEKFKYNKAVPTTIKEGIEFKGIVINLLKATCLKMI